MENEGTKYKNMEDLNSGVTVFQEDITSKISRDTELSAGRKTGCSTILIQDCSGNVCKHVIYRKFTFLKRIKDTNVLINNSRKNQEQK